MGTVLIRGMREREIVRCELVRYNIMNGDKASGPQGLRAALAPAGVGPNAGGLKLKVVTNQQ